MLIYPDIDPIIFSIGPVSVRWYGMMYIIGFLLTYYIARYRIQKTYYAGFLTKDTLSDLLFYCMLGVVVGGRTGYVLFYNFGQFINDPLWLFRVWEGGMSFHGGMLGVAVAVVLFGRKHKKQPFALLDFLAPMSAVGLLFGRIGNFIGGELYGRATDMPWGMVFRHIDNLPRHPSQLYEAFSEGLLLAIILFAYSRKKRPTMAVAGAFVLGYGIFRFMIEFVREPDKHLGFVLFDWLTMGQILSFPMALLGLALIWLAYKNNKDPLALTGTKIKHKK